MSTSQSPISKPQSPSPNPQVERVVGAILGMAIGDALGAPVDGWSAVRIQQQVGVIEDYVDLNRTPGLYTARTQQALCLVDSLIEAGEFDPLALAARFVRFSKMLHQKWPIYGAFRASSRGFRDVVDCLAKSETWETCGGLSASNEPAIRVIPLALWGRERRVVQFRDDVLRCAWLTHHDPRALAGALAMGYATIHAVNHPDPARLDPRAFLGEMAEFVRKGEALIGKRYWPEDLKLPKDAVHDLSNILARTPDWHSRPLEEALSQVKRHCRPLADHPVDATSPFAVASVTTALLLFTRFFNDPREALVHAVNRGGDTSGLGAMVGGLVGALHGRQRLPRVWLDGLQNADTLTLYATALALEQPLPPDTPPLARVEAALTEAEIPRLKRREMGE